MKALVITHDNCNRMNPGTSECIQAFRPSVVTITEFIKTLSMEDKIDVMAKNLPDTVTDADFEKVYNESGRNQKLAVQAFMSAVTFNESGDLDDDKEAEKAADAAAAAAATPEASSGAAKGTVTATAPKGK